MSDTSGQKSEKPTPKKLKDARKKGQVAFSRDASSIAIFVVALFAIFLLVPRVGDAFEHFFREGVKLASLDRTEPAPLLALLQDTLVQAALLPMPLLVAVVVMGSIFGLTQTRFNLSWHPLKPELNKLSPIKKLKQWFSVGGLFEFGKTLLKLLIVFLLAYLVVYASLWLILRLGFAEPPVLMKLIGDLSKRFLISVAIVFAAIAGLDFLFQRWKHQRDLRMTKDEVKREHKDQEGDPQFKGHRRGVHREMAMQDVKQAVVRADAVLVNPTHLAVAIHYDRKSMPAPIVTARGQEHAARRIKRFARQAGTPVLHDVALARALFVLEVGDLIPEELYEPVAEVLSFVFDLREKQRAARAGGATEAPDWADRPSTSDSEESVAERIFGRAPAEARRSVDWGADLGAGGHGEG